MAVVKLMESFIDSQEMLYNLCHYVVGEPGSLKRHFSYGRGVNPNNAFEEFKYMQELFGKTDKRLAYHIKVDFNQEIYLEIKDAITIGYELSDLFFPGHQLIFSVHGKHTGQENLQLHFVINTLSLFGRENLDINSDRLRFIRKSLKWIMENCI